MSLHIYIEGGGDRNELKIRCRRGYQSLLGKMGLQRMPRTVACGGRDTAFDKFKTAIRNGQDAILLVDSEDPVAEKATPWSHLKARDGWDQPANTDDEQAQLMVTCMETWIVADHEALKRVFGSCMRESSLPPLVELESRNRHDVLAALENATKSCGRTRMYKKGARSFQILGELNPSTLKTHLPHFEIFEGVLKKWV